MNKEILREVVRKIGNTGYETFISNYIEQYVKSAKMEVYRDKLGSVYGFKKSIKADAPTIMIDAHMDTPGFIVTNITKEGFLKIDMLGHIGINNITEQKLIVWNKQFTEKYVGVVLKPFNPNSLSNIIPDNKITVEDVLVDIGAKSKDEAINKFGVVKGSIVEYNSEFVIQGDRCFAPKIDNRLGVTLILELINYIKDRNYPFNIYIGCSTQEENGLKGVRTSAFGIEPDLGIVVDISPSFDYPNSNGYRGELGKGTMLRHADRLYLTPPKVVKYLRDLMNRKKIKYQNYVSPGGTNAFGISLTKGGCPIIPVGLVARNIHANSAIFDIRDYDATLKLLIELTVTLTKKDIDDFKKLI